jgi:hypothetical protein
MQGGATEEDNWLHDHEFQGIDLEGRHLRSEDLRGLLDEFYALRDGTQQQASPRSESSRKLTLETYRASWTIWASNHNPIAE